MFWKSLKPRSLTGQLALWSVGVVIISLPLFWGLFSQAVVQISRDVVDQRLLEFGTQARGHWASTRAVQETDDPQQLRFSGGPDAQWVWQISVDKQVQDQSDLLRLTEENIAPSIVEPAPLFSLSSRQTPLGEMRIAERVVVEQDAHVHYLVALSLDRFQVYVREHADRLQGLALLAVVPVSLILLAMLAFLVLSARRSLGQVSDAMAHYEQGASEQIEGDFAQELAALVDRMNGLLRQNQKLIERTRKYVSKIAHDINHPLAIMKNGLNRPDRGEADTDLLNRQIDRMAGLVDRYSSLARAIGPDGQTVMNTAVLSVLSDSAEGFAILYRRTPLTITCDCDEALTFAVPRHDLEAMISNLVSNAHKYADGVARLSAGRNEEHMWMCVEDDGPGIPEDIREEAVNWGKRLDEAPPGTGFGLSIVRDIAELYDGTVELGSSDLGGLKVTVRLPVRAS